MPANPFGPDDGVLAVIELPNDDRGNDIHALVVANEAVLERRDLLSFLAERLAAYKLPRSVEYVDHPLRDDAGKVRRSVLRSERLVI